MQALDCHKTKLKIVLYCQYSVCRGINPQIGALTYMLTHAAQAFAGSAAEIFSKVCLGASALILDIH